MKERIIVLLVAFGFAVGYDWFQVKNKREKAAYAVLMIFAVYMGLDYVVNRNWIDFYDLIKPVIGGAAHRIDKLLTLPGK